MKIFFFLGSIEQYSNAHLFIALIAFLFILVLEINFLSIRTKKIRLILFRITHNLFFYRLLQCGTSLRKTVVPSDSGYLTTEGSEKTIGDVCFLFRLSLSVCVLSSIVVIG